MLEALGMSATRCMSLNLEIHPHHVVATATYMSDPAGIGELIKVIRILKAAEIDAPAQS
ncbi:hypothetical protein ACSFA8_20705 [Variovorax sp. RT4R15]|uniref:hypothetical protein n=1 Tax=Variovorax sp. RT4R15 TaxID=3443737 RepID=UPI003F484D2F